jgi:Amidohydrolase family
MRPSSTGWLLTLLAAASSLGGGSPALAGGAGEAAPSEIRSTIRIGGETTGLQTTRVEAAGVVESLYHREGPGGRELKARFVLGPAGIPTAVEITGTNEVGEAVAERFSWDGSVAAWSSGVDEGRRQLAHPAFYLPSNGSPAAIALLARALLAAPGGRLPLLPGGEASLEELDERQLTGEGGSPRVTLVAISGLDFSPTFVWLDGENRFAASIEGVVEVIRQGWEGSAAVLEEAQEAAASRLLARRAQELAHHSEGALVFRGVGLFDAAAARVVPDQTVVVEANRIVAVGPRKEVSEPPGAEVVDGRGRTLLPGLWDLHVHLGAEDGLLYLAGGVTGVRDLGNVVEKVLAIRRRWDSGEEAGPRMVLAGLIDGPGGMRAHLLVATAAEARAAVDRYADLGYVQVKLYNALPRELVPVIVARAKQRGMRVSGHLPDGMTAREVVEAGFDEIQHMHSLFRGWVPAPGASTLVERAEVTVGLDLDGPQVSGLVALLAQRKIAVDPTLFVYEQGFGERVGGLCRGWLPVADRLPPQVRRQLLSMRVPIPPGKEDLLQRSVRTYLAMTAKLYAAGVTLIPGTDGMAGFALHRELELRVEAGIPAPQVLQSATLGAARIVRRDDELGLVAPGKLADLVLVEGDPSREISDLRRVVLTVKDGVLYRAAELDRVLGVRPD